MLVYLFVVLFDPENGGSITPKHPLTFIELQGVIFHKTEFFVTVAVKTQFQRVTVRRLRVACLENPDSILGWNIGFSLHCLVQIGSGVHPTSYPINAQCSAPRIKLLGGATDPSPLNSALDNSDIKNAWSYNFTPSCFRG
jgi:hypothetical protein